MDNKKLLDRVFVYGTLKQGHGNNRLLSGCTLLGAYITAQTFRMYNAGFPVTFYYPEGHRVLGEVYEIPQDILDQTISRLDQLEAEGRMYSRETVSAIPLSNAEPPTETYMYVGIPDFWHIPDTEFMVPKEMDMLAWEGRHY